MSLKERRERYVRAHNDGYWDRATSGHRLVLSTVRNMADEEELHILDVGCGTGFIIRELRQSGFITTGIEIATCLFDRELKDLPVFYFSVSKINFFPLHSFDVVLFCDSLPYMTEEEVEIACEYSKVLAAKDTIVTIETTKSLYREIEQPKEWWDGKLFGYGFQEIKNSTKTLFYRRPCADPAFN